MNDIFLNTDSQKPGNGKPGLSDEDVEKARKLVELMDDLEESPTVWRIRTILRIAMIVFIILVIAALFGFVAWEALVH